MSIVIPLELVNVHEIVCSGTARASHVKMALDPLFKAYWSKGGLAITGTPAKKLHIKTIQGSTSQIKKKCTLNSDSKAQQMRFRKNNYFIFHVNQNAYQTL